MNIRRQPAPWVNRAIWTQLLLLVYLEVVEWVNLFPWNDIRHGNGQEGLDIGLGIFMTLAIMATWLHWRWAIWLAGVTYTIWIGLQIQTWWWSYAFGASPEWKRIWMRVFSRSTQILPIVGRHLPPDGCHFVLQILLAAALIASLMAAWSLRSKTDSEQDQFAGGVCV